MHANASRHSALSYGTQKIETQLKPEVAVLLVQAEGADEADVPDGMSIPEELERRRETAGEACDGGATMRPGEDGSSASKPSIRRRSRRASED